MSASTDPHFNCMPCKITCVIRKFLAPATKQDMKLYKCSFERYSLASKTGKTTWSWGKRDQSKFVAFYKAQYSFYNKIQAWLCWTKSLFY